MRIAILGAGLAGLGLLWHLLEKGVEAVLFDPQGIAGGASGISTGLLHPFPGKRALRSWRAEEGMQATRELLEVAEKALGHPVSQAKGIFRPAITEQQKRDFSLRAQEDDQAKWEKLSLQGMSETEGLWIESGITVYSRLYLQGLWLACERHGAMFVKEEIRGLSELSGFDRVVLATGFQTLQFGGCETLPLKATLGQMLLCRWENPLPFSLVSQGHITPTEHPELCQVGSTYEHTPFPDPEKGSELLEKVALFYPPASKFEILEIRAGTRVTRREGYRPVVDEIAPKLWVFTGLGSRGLLYHAWLGRALAEALAEKRDYLEPRHLYKSLEV